MSTEFFEKLNQLNAKEVPFVVATVIRITGSVSAKPGAKSIIDSNGKTLYAVRVNRFKAKNRAEKIGKDIKSKIGVDYRVLYRPINKVDYDSN